ncbi:hypothetical protein JCM11641_005604 [Rhodosporidiobolus odoratus]
MGQTSAGEEWTGADNTCSQLQQPYYGYTPNDIGGHPPRQQAYAQGPVTPGHYSYRPHDGYGRSSYPDPYSRVGAPTLQGQQPYPASWGGESTTPFVSDRTDTVTVNVGHAHGSVRHRKPEIKTNDHSEVDSPAHAKSDNESNTLASPALSETEPAPAPARKPASSMVPRPVVRVTSNRLEHERAKAAGSRRRPPTPVISKKKPEVVCGICQKQANLHKAAGEGSSALQIDSLSDEKDIVPAKKAKLEKKVVKDVGKTGKQGSLKNKLDNDVKIKKEDKKP